MASHDVFPPLAVVRPRREQFSAATRDSKRGRWSAHCMVPRCAAGHCTPRVNTDRVLSCGSPARSGWRTQRRNRRRRAPESLRPQTIPPLGRSPTGPGVNRQPLRTSGQRYSANPVPKPWCRFRGRTDSCQPAGTASCQPAGRPVSSGLCVRGSPVPAVLPSRPWEPTTINRVKRQRSHRSQSQRRREILDLATSFILDTPTCGKGAHV